MSSSAQRALQILEIVSTAREPIGVTAIAQELGLSAATVYRSLDALERLGYIGRYQSSTDYVAGDTTKRLRQTAFARFSLRDISLPYMRQMSFATGESVTLTVPVGHYGVVVAAVTGSNPIRTSSNIGAIGDLSSSLPARVLLSSLDEEALAKFVTWAAGKQIDLAPQLRATLASIKASGYGSEAIGFSGERASVALPVRYDGKTLGVIAIEGPVLSGDGETDREKLGNWQRIVASIEVRIADQPALFANPYGHLDPDVIDLPVS